MNKLTDSLHIPLLSINEESVNAKMLIQNKKLFIYSSKAHNEVITSNNNWERFLRYVPKNNLIKICEIRDQNLGQLTGLSVEGLLI